MFLRSVVDRLQGHSAALTAINLSRFLTTTGQFLFDQTDLNGYMLCKTAFAEVRHRAVAPPAPPAHDRRH